MTSQPDSHSSEGDGRITDGIAAERELLRELRGDADLVIDTSSLNVHELRAKMDAQFAGDEEPELRATVMSFGFKYAEQLGRTFRSRLTSPSGRVAAVIPAPAGVVP
jgi:RNase adaptor protein for sRNA GlmZ degradation